MLVSVIGPTALVSGLDVAEFPRRQDRQLLAALAVDPRRTWRVDELTDALWPGGSVPSGAGKLVRNLVSRVRRLLGSGSIDSASDGYRLGSAVALDVELLFGHVDPLTEPPAIHRGRPFCDVEDWPEAWAAIARVERRRVELAEQRASALLGEGRWAEAAVQAEHLVDVQPFSDRSWLLLAHAIAGAGRRREALEAIQRARRALAEAGLEPRNDLRSLEAALLAGEEQEPTVGTGRNRSEPDTPAPSPFAMGVPDLGTRFVGRRDDLNVVVEALANHPVVCLVGLGGIGKTRLAIEAARLVAAETGAGVAFVDLGPGTTDESVADIVARALGLPAASGADAALEAWCITANALIMLDNAEAVIAETAALADRLHRAGRSLRVLITSRLAPQGSEALVLPIGPLALPEAVELFERRCTHRHPRTAVEALCDAVDCVPLAVETIAAQAVYVHPDDLRERLDRIVLEPRSGPNPASVLGVVKDSIAALEPRLLRALRWASLFPAPFTLAAFEAVADPSEQDDPLDLLGGLVRHALLSVSFGAPTRYRLLDLVRAAADQPTVSDRARLVQWGVAVADATGNGDGIALLADIPNLGAAAQTAWEAQDITSALRLALLQFPLSIVGRTEGFTWAQRALALVGDGELDGELAATVGGQTGWNMVQMAQTNGAEQLCTRVLTDALPDCLGAGWAHLGLTVLRGDARDDRALDIALALDDATLELGTRSMLAGMLAVTDPSSAQAHAEASRLRAARSEEPWQTVLAQYTCAVSLAASDLAGASAILREARDLADRSGFYFQSAVSRALLVAWAPPSNPPPIEESVVALRAVLEAGIPAMSEKLLSPIAAALAGADRQAEAAAVNDLLHRLHAKHPTGRRIFAPAAESLPDASTAGFYFPKVVSLLRHLTTT